MALIETIQLRVHGAKEPTLVYLPGLHGDWTLVGAFRGALGGRARLVEFAYPRRTDWTLEDYAQAVESALFAQGIQRAWLLGESFSSQVAWTLVDRAAQRASANHRPESLVEWQGLILVGGFVKHPWPWGVALARQCTSALPAWFLKKACAGYARVAGRRIGGRPERCAELQEFVTRRTEACDRPAVTSRYRIISGRDLRPVARRVTLPVYHLSGAIDPIVPWWQVRSWLRRYCPGYRESHIVRRAGHNVLLDAATESAEQILRWSAP